MSAYCGLQATPWARDALATDPMRSLELGTRAGELGAEVSVNAKSPHGPWIVRVGKGSRTLTFRGHVLFETVAFGLDRWAAGADDTGIAWVAGSDGLAHAQLDRGRVVWALCHRPALDQRYRHPERLRCQACWRALDRDVRAAARGAA